MNKFWKKFLAAALSAATAVTLLVPTTYVKAEREYSVDSEEAGEALAAPSADDAAVSYGTGYVEPEGLEVSAEPSSTPSRSIRRNASRRAAQVDTTSTEYQYWSKFASKYYYNHMTDAQKNLYDALSNACYPYLLSDVAYDSANGIKAYYTSSLSEEDKKHVVVLFMNANPQFYFLQNKYQYGTDSDGKTYVSLLLYDSFVETSARSTATAAMKTSIEDYYSKVQNVTGTVGKEAEINRLLADNVTYVAGNSAEKQTSYCALVSKEAVCAGYAEAFELLMTGLNYKVITVTSKGHEWNKIEINDKWYIVDPTWDDATYTDGTSPTEGTYSYYKTRYKWLNVTDAFSVSNEVDSNQSHETESYYSSFGIPSCTDSEKPYDSGVTPTSVLTQYQDTENHTYYPFTEDVTLSPVVLPINANQSVSYSSSETTVAEISTGGKITRKNNGNSTITIASTVNSSVKNVFAIKVSGIGEEPSEVKVTKITVSGNSEMTEGDSAEFKATVEPTNATNSAVTWASSDTSVATVDEKGLVTAKAAGTVKIKATAADSSLVSGEISITVKAKTISVSSVSLDKNSLSLEKDGTATLKATVTPSNATNKNVSWASSNTSVATVDESGKVTAKGKGTAKITVKTEDGGKSAECTVTVTETEKPGEGEGGSTGGSTGETGGSTGGSTGETGGSTGGTTGGSTGETGGSTGGSIGGNTGGTTGETGGSTGESTGGSTGGNTGNSGTGSSSTGSSSGKSGSTSSGNTTGSTSGGNTSGSTSSGNTNESASGSTNTSTAGSTSTSASSSNANASASTDTSASTIAPVSTPSERTINTTPTTDEIAGRNLVSTVVVQPTATDDGGIKHQEVYVQSDVFKVQQAIESLSKNKILRSLSRTRTVTIDMKQGANFPANIIPKEVLKAAEGEKVNLKFDMGDYSWSIKGKDITDAGVKDINLGLNETSQVIPEDVMKSVSGKNPNTQFSIKHSGEFGFQARLTLYVGKQYKGKYANFYTYDGNNIELSGYAKVNKKGYVTVDFNHGPYYGIVFSKRHAKPSK